MQRSHKLGLLVLVCIAALVALGFVGPIPQDPAYHHFADTRTIAGVANFWNVLSNLPFLLAGLYGLWRYPLLVAPQSRPGYLTLCVGILLVAFGSAGYHLAPSNASLVWDRLPMTLAFMALLALLIGERVSERHGNLVLAALVACGAVTVLYWDWTESQGRGDLRPYALVQFLPLLLIPLLLLLFPARYIRSGWLFAAFVLYALAKLCEEFDRPLYGLLGLSGHTLKHLVAAVAALCIVLAVAVRSTREATTARHTG